MSAHGKINPTTDTLLRWDVTLTQDGRTTKIDTFTWGRTRQEAYARIAQAVDSDPLWEGWSFTLATRPTGS